ncbi:MAG: twin-arginine translocation signal domain-containing protein, partial [Candidatus Aminicenantes bacterium]|nr:twin-arginine translocation signal domain-containing protein [Candidatus Aminicenantes bacterium]
MRKNEPRLKTGWQPHCCPRVDAISSGSHTLTRRTFLKGMGATALGGMALSGLSWPVLAAGETEDLAFQRVPLKVKPILVYSTPQRRLQTSWRAWGAIQTQEDANQEVAR